MMQMFSAAQRVKTQITNLLEEEGLQLNENKSLTEQFDSIQILALLIALERVFQIEISPFELNEENFYSLDRIADFIIKKLMSKVNLSS